MNPMTAQAWLDRCTAELQRQIQDEGVQRSDLEQVAREMLEEPLYRNLEPEDAAKGWARDHA